MSRRGLEVWRIDGDPASLARDNIFRFLLSLDGRCSASNMFVCRNVNSVSVMQRIFITGFVKRLHASENVILQNIMSSDLRYTSQLGKIWSKLVYHNINVF